MAKDTSPAVCRWCGGAVPVIPHAGRGRRRQYCSQACRSAAWRQGRKLAKSQADAVQEVADAVARIRLHTATRDDHEFVLAVKMAIRRGAAP